MQFQLEGVRGGGGFPTILYGEAPPPLVQSLLYTIFDRKGSPFVYFLLTNGTPFTCHKTLYKKGIWRKSNSGGSEGFLVHRVVKERVAHGQP